MTLFLCEICLKPADRTLHKPRNLSTFYDLCPSAAEGIKEARAWLCSFCWTRISQCVVFMETVKSSRLLLTQFASENQVTAIRPTNLHSYKVRKLPDIVVENADKSHLNLVVPNSTLKTEFGPKSRAARARMLTPAVHNSKKIKRLQAVPSTSGLARRITTMKSVLLKKKKVLRQKLSTIKQDPLSNCPSSVQVKQEYVDTSNVHIKQEPKIEIEITFKEEPTETVGKTEAVLDDTVSKTNVQTNKDGPDVPKVRAIWKPKQGYMIHLAGTHEFAAQGGFQIITVSDEEAVEALKYKRAKRFGRLPFRCTSCGEGYAEETKLKKHLTLHSKSAGSYVCHICTLHFAKPELLQQHKAVQHYRRLKCYRCSTVINNSSSFYAHGVRCSGATSCPICSKDFSNQRRLIIHTRRNHIERPKKHTCDCCGKSFKYSSEMKAHRASHSTDKPYECDHCQKKYKSKLSMVTHILRAHSPTPKKVEDMYCPECDKFFKSKYLLEYHLKNALVHRKVEDFSHECSDCHRKFHNRSNLELHYRVHHKNSEIPCPMCDKMFKVETYLKKHIERRHVPKKNEEPRDPIVCDLCGSLFKELPSLQKHMLAIHEKKRPFKCEMCGATFGFSSALYTHKRLKHGVAKKRA